MEKKQTFGGKKVQVARAETRYEKSGAEDTLNAATMPGQIAEVACRRGAGLDYFQTWRVTVPLMACDAAISRGN